MPSPFPCPRCRRPVEIDDEATDVWLTCGHCLLQLRNPRRDEATTTAPAAPAPPVALSCDVCGQAMEPAWRYCPHCNTPRRRSVSRARDTRLEADIQRDDAASGAAAWVMAGVAATAIIIFVASFGGEVGLRTEEGRTVMFFVSGAVVLVIGLVTALVRSNSDAVAKVAGGVLGGMALVAIVGLGIILMICASCSGMLDDFAKGMQGRR